MGGVVLDARCTVKIFKRKTAKNKPHSAVVGEWGEGLAVAFLKRAGYTVLGRNVRPDRRDEIDVIVRNSDTLVFVEVKTRVMRISVLLQVRLMMINAMFLTVLRLLICARRVILISFIALM